MSYYTFKRSATNFEEFATARKIHDQGGLTRDEARERCKEFNDNRTAAQIQAGTKLEFEEQ